MLGPAADCLLFDGVLEWWRDGRWCSGPTALSSATTPTLDFEDPGITAILEARRGPDRSPVELAQFLYGYGRKPFSLRWVQAVGGQSPESLAAWYGIDERSDTQRILARWALSRGEEWWTWRCPQPSHASDGMSWKLYVNVEPAALPLAIAQVAQVLDSVEATAFKVAGSARAALRPDKLVLYFSRRESMEQAGQDLWRALSRTPSHPLPFTARLGGLSGITWGIDPPRTGWMARGSWRSWLCSKIAGIQWGLRACRDDAQFLEHFSARLSADGIGIESWVPSNLLLRLWDSGHSPERGPT